MRHPSSTQPESITAARNAVTLGTSLAMTAGMALLVQLVIPRFLGPHAFGELRLAESFGEMLLIILTFGVDMQLRREAAIDPSRAQRYLAGLTAMRVVLGAALIAGTVVLLKTMGSSDRVVAMFVLIAMSQMLLALNNSYAALEHASGHVTWLARTNLGVKTLWLVAMIAVATQLASGLAVAMTALTVEALRFAWFTARAVRRHQIQLRPDLRLAAGAIVASLPFFVNGVAHNLYARIGTGWLAASCNEVEVGLYGAAARIASVALIGMPLMSWVLVPSTARAAAQSDQQRDQLVAGALRIALLAGVPLAAALHVGAPLLLRLLLGPDYLAAAPVLRIMAPTAGLAYVSTVCAIALIQCGRTWTVAGVSLAGVVLTVILDAALISWGAHALGPAGGAQGAAWATLGTEVAVTIALGVASRVFWLDAKLRRTAAALAGALAAMALAVRFAPWPATGSSIAAVAAFAIAMLASGGVDRHDFTFCLRVLTPSRRSSPAVLIPEVS